MKSIHEILFEAFLLLEYDRAKTIQQHGEKALNVALGRDEHDSYLNDVVNLHSGRIHPRLTQFAGQEPEKVTPKDAAMHELMGQFEECDPTPQKKYVQHIARIYGHGGVNRHEDIYARMKPALRDFHDLATRKIIPAEHRDIGRIKSLDQLEDLVDAHRGQQSGKEISKSYAEQMKSPEHATVTEHGSFTHIIPHTEEASNFHGRGTKWCTAGDEGNMFASYNSQGPLHVLVPKEPKYSGEKYQYHYSSDQLMNEKDRPVGNTGHNDIDTFVHDYRSQADNAHQSRAGFDHPEAKVRRRTLNNYWDSATEDDVGKVVEKGMYGPYEEDHYRETDPSIGKSPIEHPNFNDDHLETVLNHPNWDVRTQGMWARGFNQRHIDNLVDSVSYEKMGSEYSNNYQAYEMRHELFKRTTNPQHFEDAWKTFGTKSEDRDALEGLAFNPKAPAHMISAMIRDKDKMYLSHYAAQNKNASDEDLQWASKNHPVSATRANADHAIEQRENAKRRKNGEKEITWY